MQGTQIAFEFHLSFQKLQGHQLIGSSFLLAECSRSVWTPFFILDDGYIGFLLHFLKIEMSSLFVFEKRGGLSSGFWKGPRGYKGSFQIGERFARIFENSNEI